MHTPPTATSAWRGATGSGTPHHRRPASVWPVTHRVRPPRVPRDRLHATTRPRVRRRLRVHPDPPGAVPLFTFTTAGRAAMTIRVALADDHPMFRFGLRAMLDQSPDITVIGEADDGDGLLALVDQADPDVVLTDLTMGNLDGVTVIRTLAATHPQLPVIALTMHHDDSHLRAALRAGARGYLLKGADGTAIVRAVHTAASGQTVLDPAVRDRLISAYTGDQAAPPPLFPDLTTRETDVLRLISRGCGNRGNRHPARPGRQDHQEHHLLRASLSSRSPTAPPPHYEPRKPGSMPRPGSQVNSPQPSTRPSSSCRLNGTGAEAPLALRPQARLANTVHNTTDHPVEGSPAHRPTAGKGT